MEQSQPVGRASVPANNLRTEYPVQVQTDSGTRVTPRKHRLSWWPRASMLSGPWSWLTFSAAGF